MFSRSETVGLTEEKKMWKHLARTVEQGIKTLFYGFNSDENLQIIRPLNH